MSEVVKLWPGAAPDGFDSVPPEATFRMPAAPGGGYDWLRNVSDPSLTVVRPKQPNGAAVVICPGGGWRILAWGHEGMDAAHWFAARGVTAFVLKYRLMPTPQDPAKFDELNKRSMAREGELGRLTGRTAPRMLSDLVGDPVFTQARDLAAADGRQALALVRERASGYGIDPARVGMIGFSAGAFLTADVAMAPGGPPLAFAAPIYGGDTRSREVPADAPPLFTCIAQDDRMLYRVVEGLYSSWSDADRPAELHIFQKGGHGFGMAPTGLPVDRWIELLEAWLRDLGLI